MRICEVSKAVYIFWYAPAFSKVMDRVVTAEVIKALKERRVEGGLVSKMMLDRAFAVGDVSVSCTHLNTLSDLGTEMSCRVCVHRSGILVRLDASAVE